jgi:hypothetical protein
MRLSSGRLQAEVTETVSQMTVRDDFCVGFQPQIAI